MKAIKKIKGFTLIEMLVTLSLSTVVVAFAYMAFNYIFSSFNQYEKMNAEIGELTGCHRQLQKLFNRAELIEIKENNMYVYLKGEDKINIQLTESAIVFLNESGTLDTVHCVLKTSEAFFGDKTIKNGYIDRLSLGIELNKTPYRFEFKKLYDSEKMMILDSLNTFAVPWQK